MQKQQKMQTQIVRNQKKNINPKVAWVEEKLPFLASSLIFQLVTAVGAAVADQMLILMLIRC